MRRKGLVFLACMLICVSGCGSAVGKGTELLESEKYEEAAEEFQTSISKEKDVKEAYEGLGIAYMELEKYEKAVWAFEQALGNGAEETVILYNLAGVSSMQSEQYKKAVQFFEKAQKLDGASEELTKEIARNLVISYEKAGEYQAAKEKLEDYLKAYPEDEEALKEQEFLNTQS